MKKIEIIHARVSKEESDLLNFLAMQKGRNISETLRLLLWGEIEREHLTEDFSKFCENNATFVNNRNATSNIVG